MTDQENDPGFLTHQIESAAVALEILLVRRLREEHPAEAWRREPLVSAEIDRIRGACTVLDSSCALWFGGRSDDAEAF